MQIGLTTQDQVLRGQDYEEVLTADPGRSSVLTGLFLDVDVSGPDGSSESFERALVDRLGYAARQTGQLPAGPLDLNCPTTHR